MSSENCTLVDLYQMVENLTKNTTKYSNVLKMMAEHIASNKNQIKKLNAENVLLKAKNTELSKKVDDLGEVIVCIVNGDMTIPYKEEE